MTREQILTRRLLLALVVEYMRLPPGDPAAREAWAQRVREAFPYGRLILTVKLGELLERRESA